MPKKPEPLSKSLFLLLVASVAFLERVVLSALILVYGYGLWSESGRDTFGFVEGLMVVGLAGILSGFSSIKRAGFDEADGDMDKMFRVVMSLMFIFYPLLALFSCLFLFLFTRAAF